MLTINRITSCIGIVGILPQIHAQPFQQDTLADGVISIEAESFTAVTTNPSNQTWVVSPSSAASGGLLMACLPNLNLRYNTGYETLSPRLDYEIEFNRGGTHYLAARGYGMSSDDDSFHAGINGIGSTAADRIGSFGRGLEWRNDTMDGTIATLEVPGPGVHTLNIWMREDGFFLDKIVVSTATDFLPIGEGPPESSNGTAAESEIDPRESWFHSISMSNGMIVAEAVPVPGVASVSVKQRDDVGATWSADPDSDIFAYRVETLPSDEKKMLMMDVTPLDAEQERAAILMNRIAFGHTPDLLDHVVRGSTPIGPEVWLDQQLNPEALSESAAQDAEIQALADKLEHRTADLDDLRAWTLLNAIRADRQFLEVMSQFINNHFVTQYGKNQRWFRDRGYSWSEAGKQAVQLDYRELKKWRQVLLNPNGTFYDLLRISAESPSMLIYLDTESSTALAPNENYSREILELFCMGVDNGYDQQDIEAMSPVWTGWTVAQVHPGSVDDPFAPEMTNAVTLLSEGRPWQYRRGTNEPPANWNQPGFTTDASWFTGDLPIGFSDSDDATVLDDMRHNYTTVYIRKEVVVTNAADIPFMNLSLYVDDGAVVYINGTEAYRFNVHDGQPTHSSTTPSYINNAEWAMAFTDLSAYLTPGTNVIAIVGVNSSLSNNDFSLDAKIDYQGVWSFVFDEGDHAEEAKIIFPGKTVNSRFGTAFAGQAYELAIPARTGPDGLLDGYDVLEHLSELPQTAEFISVKLCRLLIHETFGLGNYFNISQNNPESDLIKNCMDTWFTPGPDGRVGNLRLVFNTILNSDLSKGQGAASQKVKTPMEYTVSAVRSLRKDLGGGIWSASTDGYDLIEPMDRMGMGLYQRGTPDGWPEEGAEWIDTSTVNERLRFIQNFLRDANDPDKGEDYGWNEVDTVADPVALLQSMLSGSALLDPLQVSTTALNLIYPGSGLPNLEAAMEECFTLLNSDSAGGAGTSPFSSLSVGSPDYDRRIRSLFGLILADPRFNEQ